MSTLRCRFEVQASRQAQHFVDLGVWISWQAQYFVDLEVQISWQARHFVSLEVQVFSKRRNCFVDLEVQISWRAQYWWTVKWRFCGRHSALWTLRSRFRGGCVLGLEVQFQPAVCEPPPPSPPTITTVNIIIATTTTTTATRQTFRHTVWGLLPGLCRVGAGLS